VRVFVKTVMNFWAPLKAHSVLTDWEAVDFSRKSIVSWSQYEITYLQDDAGIALSILTGYRGAKDFETKQENE
jgi:hypothetical protein